MRAEACLIPIVKFPLYKFKSKLVASACSEYVGGVDSAKAVARLSLNYISAFIIYTST